MTSRGREGGRRGGEVGGLEVKQMYTWTHTQLLFFNLTFSAFSARNTTVTLQQHSGDSDDIITRIPISLLVRT